MVRLEQARAASLEASRVSQAKAKRENAAHTCPSRVYKGGGFASVCGKTAAHEHEGKFYCKTHHPPTVAKKYADKSDALKVAIADRLEQNRAARLAADEQKRRADCYDDLLEALRLIATAENSALDLAYCKGLARAAIAKATGEQP